MWVVLFFFIFIYFVGLPAVRSHSLYMIEQSTKEIVLYLISDFHSKLIHSGKKYEKIVSVSKYFWYEYSWNYSLLLQLLKTFNLSKKVCLYPQQVELIGMNNL